MKLDFLFEAKLMGDGQIGMGDVSKKTSAKQGGKDGTQQGGHEYQELAIADKFNIEYEPEKNIETDPPYDTHIKQKED